MTKSEQPPITLRQRMLEAQPAEQDSLLVRQAGNASNAELIDLIVSPPEPTGAFVPRRLDAILTVRGPAVVGAIAATMLEHPLTHSTRRLASILAEIQHRHAEEAERVAKILISTVRNALDAGADTWAVGELLGWYLRTIESGKASPEAANVAEQILALAGTERDPYLLAVDRSHEVLERSQRDRG